MSLWKIAWRSIEQRALSSILTGLSLALGVTLVVAVVVAHGVVDRSFQTGASLGYNMIIGAKGGDLQMVLNTVYYLSRPVENIPYTYYKEFLPASKRKDGQKGRFADYVERAVPVCMGDSFEGFRVVGTTPEMFDFQYGQGKKYEFAAGDRFKEDNFWGAVVGSYVARQTGVKVGSKFQITHGVEAGHKHDEQFEVAGILAPTGTPNDRAVFVNMEGFYLIGGHERPEEMAGDAHGPMPVHAAGTTAGLSSSADVGGHALLGKPAVAPEDHDHDADHDHEHADHDADHDHDHDHDGHDEHGDHDEHEHHHHGPLPESQREVTAILLLTSSFGGDRGPSAMYLVKPINKDNMARAVAPMREITGLFDIIVGPIQTLLLVLAVLIVIVSGIGIMVSIYNSMSDRRHDIAVMRALGARRSTVMTTVLLESILLSLGGGLLGWLLGHAMIGAISPWIEAETGVMIGFLQFVPKYELILIPGLILLASLVGFLPALAAYRTDVAKSLSATP